MSTHGTSFCESQSLAAVSSCDLLQLRLAGLEGEALGPLLVLDLLPWDLHAALLLHGHAIGLRGLVTLGLWITMLAWLIGTVLSIAIVAGIANGLVDHDAPLFALAVTQIGRLALLVENRIALFDPLCHRDGNSVFLALLALGHLLISRNVDGH